MEIAEVLRRTRNESGKSQESMAFELQVARKTIQNWESGTSEPSVSQFIEWFKVVGKNPLPFLLQNVYPEMDKIDINNDDAKLRKALIGIIEQLPAEGMRQLMFLFYANHGSDPRAVMNLVTAHLQTPMKDRVTQAEVVCKNYEMAKKKGTVVQPDYIQPDIECVRNAINKGEEAFVNGFNEYVF